MKAFRLACSAVMAAGTLLVASGAMAAGPSTSQYQRERAVCDGIQQDRAACIREAGAAQQASQTGALTTPSPDAAMQNALARCQNQPAEDQRACRDRVRGTGNTDIEGSVLGGGAIRETVTPIPVVSTTPLPAASPIPLTPQTQPAPIIMPMPAPMVAPQPAAVVIVPVMPATAQ